MQHYHVTIRYVDGQTRVKRYDSAYRMAMRLAWIIEHSDVDVLNVLRCAVERCPVDGEA